MSARVHSGEPAALTFVEAVIRLSDPTPLTDDERRKIGELQEGPGLTQSERLALLGLRDDRKWRDVAAAEGPKDPPPAHRSQSEIFEEQAEQRRQLWRGEGHHARGMYLLAKKLGQTANAALVLQIAEALAVDPAKTAADEPPVFYRPEFLPEHVRRQHGLW